MWMICLRCTIRGRRRDVFLLWRASRRGDGRRHPFDRRDGVGAAILALDCFPNCKIN